MIAILVPCYDSIHIETAASLWNLKEPGMELMIWPSSMIVAARNALVREALDHDLVTGVLWVDSDMMFPGDSLIRLQHYGKDFVGCNYSRKDALDSSSCCALDGSRLVPKDSGLEEVGTLGMGLTWMSRKLLEAVEEPWFGLDMSEREPGEDDWFCRKARAAGFKVWVDHGLSRDICHMGKFRYLLP